MSDIRYMHRALELAFKGFPYAFPNPMVGAVITDPEGRIIGEGYHRECGTPHAEVNAINSVADKSLLKAATMYVTLEPCAHYGRTPPCAKLIIDMGIPHVVVACRDPFDKVNGKGIEMLRDAGIKVEVGMLEDECRKANAVFFTAHTLHRPFIVLKWAQTADGYMDAKRAPEAPAARISCSTTSVFTHRLRSWCDGILVGSSTVLADDPMLDTRLWDGKSPRPIVLDRRGRVEPTARIMQRNPIIISDNKPLSEIMHDLYSQGITSLLVEGGATVLHSFIDFQDPESPDRMPGLWDMARVETAPMSFGDNGQARAPRITCCEPFKTVEIERHLVKYYSRNPLIDVKNI